MHEMRSCGMAKQLIKRCIDLRNSAGGFTIRCYLPYPYDCRSIHILIILLVSLLYFYKFFYYLPKIIREIKMKLLCRVFSASNNLNISAKRQESPIRNNGDSYDEFTWYFNYCFNGSVVGYSSVLFSETSTSTKE